MTVASGATMIINGEVARENVLTNAGTVTMTKTGEMTIYNNGSTDLGGIYNLALGLWELQTNANVSDGGLGHEFFNNAGELEVLAETASAGVGVPFTNSGTVSPVSGLLEFSGAFVNNGTVAFGVSGPIVNPPVYVTGAVTLSGTASVSWLDGFVPAVSNSFNLLQYGSHIGFFANIDLPAGTTGEGVYSATTFSLLITAVSPPTNLPALTIERANPDSMIVSWPASATGFTLQTTTNLPSSWTSIVTGIGTVGTNFTFTNPISAERAFFRLESP
jgi:hypothetical protein